MTSGMRNSKNKSRKVLRFSLIPVLLFFIFMPCVSKADDESWVEINTNVENGAIDSSRAVKKGSNVVIRTEPNKGFVLDRVLVDGREASLSENVMTNIDVLMNTVDAFYSRGEEAQYDNSLRENYITPFQEDTIYTDCSGFTFASYFNAFGIEIPTSTRLLDEYARVNADTEYVVAYMGYDEYQSKKTNLMDLLKDKLKKGDLLTIRTDANKGHTMMVYDFDKDRAGNIRDVIIIHSTGRNDEYEKRISVYDENVIEGTIRKDSMKDRFAARYSGNNIISFSLIRPLARQNVFLDNEGNEEHYSGIEAGRYYIFQNVTENHDIYVYYKAISLYRIRGMSKYGLV